jgi:hypothetical protein
MSGACIRHPDVPAVVTTPRGRITIVITGGALPSPSNGKEES